MKAQKTAATQSYCSIEKKLDQFLIEIAEMKNKLRRAEALAEIHNARFDSFFENHILPYRRKMALEEKLSRG